MSDDVARVAEVPDVATGLFMAAIKAMAALNNRRLAAERERDALRAEVEFWRLKFGEESAARDRDGKALREVSGELVALRAAQDGFRKG